MTDFAELKRIDVRDIARRLGLQPDISGKVRCFLGTHEDRHPSACVYADGWKCFACGEHGDGVDLVAKYLHISTQDAVEWLRKEYSLQRKKDDRAQLEREHIYPGGQLKKLIYRREDGSKYGTWKHLEGGQWKSGRGSGTPPLYIGNATEIENIIFMVEGEKDVDALRGLSWPAFSLPDGASSRWYPEYSEPFRGGIVYIVPDNDEPGQKLARMAANELRDVADVYVLDLSQAWPEIPAKGDVSDMIAALGADEALERLLRLSQTAEKAPEPLPEFFDGRTFLHNVMGDYLIKQYGVCKINGTVHIYDDGIYRPGEDMLHGYMLRLIPTLSDARRREVFKYIRVSLDTPEKKASPPNLIPFKSRVYDISADRFLDYSSDMVFLNRFPYDYKPDAPAVPLVEQTLKAIACDDRDVIKLILEAFGNCFYLLNAYRGSVMLYGQSGSNGKSTLLNMLAQLVGRDNASFLSLQDTAERFRLVELYGKAVNIGDDIPDIYMPDSSRFKKLVTGEVVIGEKKGQDPFPFRPYAKMFFAMNALPPVSDKTRAFFSRILLIPLNNDFSRPDVKDVQLKDREWTSAEMEYLTRLAVDGLKRLIRNGDFTRPDCVTTELARYELENNPVLGFLSEYKGLEGKPTQIVYSDYRNWCDDNGYKPYAATKFSREVCYSLSLETKNVRHPYFTSGVGKCFVTP